MTKREGTANYSVSASRATDDGSGHTSPSQWHSFVEKMTEATADSLLESLHQQHLPVSRRGGQPILFLEHTTPSATGETLSRTELLKAAVHCHSDIKRAGHNQNERARLN